MDKRKIKTPGIMRKEAQALLELVKNEEIWAETDEEKVELGSALSLDVKRLPMTSFSYQELYIVFRFLVLLNQQSAEMVHYVRSKDEAFLCDVLSAGIVGELDDYVGDNMIHALNGLEITIEGCGYR